jgi:redox-sensitive bicupin YhaK (pirin superfamily)
MLATKLQPSERQIAYRTFGHTGGPITRLMSPSDLGQVAKPFVFLDLAEFDEKSPPMSLEEGWHPHSGIATITVMMEGAIRIAETTGQDVVVPEAGVEWMRAGLGVWHTGAVVSKRARAFQLWIALPPELELAPNQGRYEMPDEIPQVGPARVILGEYGEARSPIDAPPLTYLHVRLGAGERWTYTPPPGHSVAWISVARGAVRSPSRIPRGELAVFEPSEQPIDLVAETDAELVLGSSAPSPHDTVLGAYSVHTSIDALRRGHAEIRRIGRTLAAR